MRRRKGSSGAQREHVNLGVFGGAKHKPQHVQRSSRFMAPKAAPLAPAGSPPSFSPSSPQQWAPARAFRGALLCAAAARWCLLAMVAALSSRGGGAAAAPEAPSGARVHCSSGRVPSIRLFNSLVFVSGRACSCCFWPVSRPLDAKFSPPSSSLGGQISGTSFPSRGARQ